MSSDTNTPSCPTRLSQRASRSTDVNSTRVETGRSLRCKPKRSVVGACLPCRSKSPAHATSHRRQLPRSRVSAAISPSAARFKSHNRQTSASSTLHTIATAISPSTTSYRLHQPRRSRTPRICSLDIPWQYKAQRKHCGPVRLPGARVPERLATASSLSPAPPPTMIANSTSSCALASYLIGGIQNPRGCPLFATSARARHLVLRQILNLLRRLLCGKWTCLQLRPDAPQAR